MYCFLSGKISVPKVLFHDSSRNIVPFPYVIISFIKGVTLDEYMRKHECYPTKLITQIAEGLAQIHSNGEKVILRKTDIIASQKQTRKGKEEKNSELTALNTDDHSEAVS